VAKAYGLPPSALIGKPIGSVIRDASLDVGKGELAQVRQRIADVFDTGKTCEYEFTWPTITGRTHFSVRLFPELDLNGSVINVLGISRDITERKQAEETLKATTEQLRALSARIQSAREEESIRIARAIHDELGSALASLRWDLEGIAKVFSDSARASQVPDMGNKIAATLRLTDTTINIVRRIASELRPDVLDVLGLFEAIAWQGKQFQDRTGIAVHSDPPLDDVALSSLQSTALFRIFQEALTNILRHAQATTVDVTMVEKAGAFVLTISDNGRGITEDEKSGQLAIGLLGMRERAHLIGAEIDIAGIAGEGTTVTVRLPNLS
jgi:signal transduction histidine kinase